MTKSYMLAGYKCTRRNPEFTTESLWEGACPRLLCQIQIFYLIHRNRGQAPSHI